MEDGGENKVIPFFYISAMIQQVDIESCLKLDSHFTPPTYFVQKYFLLLNQLKNM